MKFVGDRLRVGRTLRGKTLRQLADEVAAQRTTLSMIELDRKEPSSDLVAALAQALQVEREYFFRPIVDEFTQKECSFRKRATTPQKTKNRILAHGTMIAELVAELEKVVKFPAPNVPRDAAPKTRAAVEEAARAAREYWGYGEGPIDNMVRVLEHAGAIVVRLHDESDKVDAFSRAGARPYVVLNAAKGSSSRTRMDLAHELGHLVMHNGATDQDEEKQADYFGGCFLLPAGAFGRHYLSYGHRVDWQHLFEMKKHWKVSVAAIVRRSYDLGLINAIEYRQRFRYINYRGWHKGEPYDPMPENPEMINTAINAAAKRAGGIRALASRLAWGMDTFVQTTGWSGGASDVEHVPLNRARLSVV